MKPKQVDDAQPRDDVETSAPVSSASWLEDVLRARLAEPVLADIRARVKEAQSGTDRAFFQAFALLPRTTGKEICELTPAELSFAAKLFDGWEPPAMRVDELARLWLVLAGCVDVDGLFRRVEALFAMADVSELVTLYRGLPLYPDGARFTGRAAEGVRSNMKAVYEAVALQNPYPSRWLSDSAFNHLVLKAFHVESTISLIQGLWTRRNPELLRMLRDYASERHSANRSVDPALWKLVEDEMAHDTQHTKSSAEGTEA